MELHEEILRRFDDADLLDSSRAVLDGGLAHPLLQRHLMDAEGLRDLRG